uniref:Ion_trans domain-containing protein n=1 Tax=Macrostomum lignano TaxID=282301 RepID=A0A1I8FHL7_9PLAT
ASVNAKASEQDEERYECFDERAVLNLLLIRSTSVYNQSLGERRKDGIKGLAVCRNCLNDEGRVSSLKLHRLVAPAHTVLWQLQWEPPHLKAMRDPVESLAVLVRADRPSAAWRPTSCARRTSTPFRRHCCWPKFLRSLGRTGATSRTSMQQGYQDGHSPARHRHAGPSAAIKDVDVTRDTNNCPDHGAGHCHALDTFGGYSILELAAKGESSSFVIIDIVQDAHQGALIELAIACGFVPLLYPLLLFPDAPRFRAHEPDYVRLRPQQHQRVIIGKRRRPLRARMRSAPEAPASRGVALLQGGRKQQKQPEEEQQPRPRLSPLAELLLPHARDGAHQLRCLLLSFVVMFQMGRAFSVGESSGYLTLLGFLVEEINEMITSARRRPSRTTSWTAGTSSDITAITCGFTAFALRIHNSTVHNPFQRYWSLVLLTTTCLVYWCACSTYRWCWRASAEAQDDVAHGEEGLPAPSCSFCSCLMFGFGVTFHALQYPEGKSIQSTGTEVARAPARSSSACSATPSTPSWASTGSTTSCPATSATSPGEHKPMVMSPTACTHWRGCSVPTVYMVLYIVVMQILLLNVIVAMFSKTIDAIDSEVKAIVAVREVRPYRGVQHQVARCAALQHPVGAAQPGVLRLAPTVPPLVRRARQPAAAVVAAEAARIPQPRVKPGHPHDCKVYLLSLYYQALASANARLLNALNEAMERFDRIEDYGQAAGVAGQGGQGTSASEAPATSATSGSSVLDHAYITIEEGREGGPLTSRVVGRVLSTFLTALSLADKSHQPRSLSFAQPHSLKNLRTSIYQPGAPVQCVTNAQKPFINIHFSA